MNFSLPYPSRQIDLHLEGHHFKLLEVADAEVLLDELIRKGDGQEDESIPYWAELWPSALGLAQFLLKRREEGLFRNEPSVLELGCGLGLPGIAAGRLGGRVTLSDYLEPALDFARSNWTLNNNQDVNCEVLDWRKPDPRMASDVLLASDITYEPSNFPYLPPAFKTLCKPGGTILLSDPRRQIAQDFFRALPAEGFKLMKYNEPVVAQGRRIIIHIYVLRM